ncbi:MAG: hypothetical protein IJI96_02760 [Methanobrevibacter sp.]|nr:hypothetical protein [Methanobrevibacter sp.]MBQ6627428.1 hypothetical protein [Methanobrevibacter sp.]
MEYVVVNCKRVRGLGNVLSPSNSDEYLTHFCSIKSGIQTIESFNHNVFTLHSYFESIGYYLLNVLGISQLVKNLRYNADSMAISYDLLEIRDTMTMRDMVGVTKNIRVEGDVIKYDTYSTSSDLNRTIFNMSDLQNLLNCLTGLSVDGDIVKYTEITEVVI